MALRISRALPRTLASIPRPSSTTPRLASSFRSGPSPPKLPATEQAEFERLQRTAAVSMAFQPEASPPTTKADEAATVKSSAAEEPVGVPIRKGAPPEFAGEVNPRTGEVGGPKNEPLRWGGAADWSYNGRATDF